VSVVGLALGAAAAENSTEDLLLLRACGCNSRWIRHD
jgi:hypothetical protein